MSYRNVVRKSLVRDFKQWNKIDFLQLCSCIKKKTEHARKLTNKTKSYVEVNKTGS